MNISRPCPIPPTFTRGSLRREETQHWGNTREKKAWAAPCLGSYWQSGPPSSEWVFSLADQFSDRQHRDWKLRRRTMNCGRGIVIRDDNGSMISQDFLSVFFKTVTKKGWCYKDDDCSSWFFLVNIGFCKKSQRNGVRHPSCDSSSSGLLVNFPPDDLQQWSIRSQDCAWSDPDTPEDPLW